MNFMEKLAASHMTEEAFKAWSGDGEQEKEAAGKAGLVSRFLGKAKEKGKAALTRIGRIGEKKEVTGKGIRYGTPAWKALSKGKKRALIAGGTVTGLAAAGAGAGAKALAGGKKSYKDRV